jgi:Ca-activated chloride channel homolog
MHARPLVASPFSRQFREPSRAQRLQPSSAEVVVRIAVAFAAALVLTSGSAFAQTAEAPQATPAPVFRSGSALVALNVSVHDGQRYVSGLQPSDFAVYEDGVKQEVRLFESSAVPVDLIVLIDGSSSMGDKIQVVHEAASGFLKTLRTGDRGAVVSFADSVTVLQPFTGDQALLEKAVHSVVAHGSTALNNAVYISLKQFGRAAKQDAEPRRQAIVVLSDGEDTSSLVSADDVLALARRMGVNIYTVALQSRYSATQAPQPGHRYFSESDYAMKTLARETGAQSFFPAPWELKAVYASISTELANQYSIGYAPANNHPDGRFRRVVVQVVTRPELRPRTRLGYTADGVPVAATLPASVPR